MKYLILLSFLLISCEESTVKLSSEWRDSKTEARNEVNAKAIQHCKFHGYTQMYFDYKNWESRYDINREKRVYKYRSYVYCKEHRDEQNKDSKQ